MPGLGQYRLMPCKIITTLKDKEAYTADIIIELASQYGR